MRLSLIGMSGTGKSHWSKKLQKEGFVRYCCDDLLEEKLVDELQSFGLSGTKALSAWMGQPYDQRYKETSKRYLALEKQVMKEIFEKIKLLPKNTNVIIDTTGSVIYTGRGILRELANLTKIIYLDTPDSVKDKMHKLYLQDPKPVIWGKAYKKRAGESDLAALKRCYPNLLAFRTKKYKKNAHKTLDYFLLREKGTSLPKFLELLNLH